MTDEHDILGRPPARKPVVEQEPEFDPNWRGEHLLAVRRNEGGNFRFTLNNATRKAAKIRRAT